MSTFLWVCGGLMVLVGAVLVGDKRTRHRVVSALEHRWEKGWRQKTRARTRQHVRAQRMSAKTMQKATPTFARPRRPMTLTKKCSAACRTSRKPAFDPKTGKLLCDCPCRGREHGMYRKGASSGPRARKGAAAGTTGTKRVSPPKPSTGTKRVSPPKPSTGAAKRAAPKAPGSVTNINEGGTVGVQRSTGAPGTRVTNINRGGTVGIQAGRVSGETVVVGGSAKVPPPPAPPSWAAPSLDTYTRMRAHADVSPRCASGGFAMRTYRDRRTDPPKVTQTVVCNTCRKEL